MFTELRVSCSQQVVDVVVVYASYFYIFSIDL